MSTMQDIFEWKLAFSTESCAEVHTNGLGIIIHCHTGLYDDIYITDDEAVVEFFEGCDSMEDALIDEGFDTFNRNEIRLAVAQQYLEHFWS